MFEALGHLPGVTAYPSNANYILFHVEGAGQVWQQLYDRGILVRDFSRANMLEDCLRVSIGNPQENDELLAALKEILSCSVLPACKTD
ncbi:MAG: aminotransferase class I/II-fold pyridoxal phosphate-dependent enzyme [Senegalimassilia faecalis]